MEAAGVCLLVLMVTSTAKAIPDTALDPLLSSREELGPAGEREAIGCQGPWFTRGDNNSCQCGAQVHGAVSCDEFTKKVSVLDCFCMTRESTTHKMVVGNCIYNCVNMSRKAEYYDFFYHPVPSSCDYLHRVGTLCGSCDHEHHYFPPVYSYDVECVKCVHSQSAWLYVAEAFLPLTLFIVVILVFRISAVSPGLHAFVTFAQITGAPIQVRILLLSTSYTTPAISILTRIITAFYGIWNLDFFRTLVPGVCMHITTMQVLALDYLIAVYPLVLMVTAYIFTELHGYGVRPVLFLWKPFHYISVRFRREWDIKTSLIDAFATFFILSSTKLFSVSFDLLIPTTLYVASGEIFGTYLFYDPTIEYMRHRSGHLYYGLLAIAVLLIFALLPLSLLIFSSCRCLQSTQRARVVRDLLYTFQIYYKDGTDGTRDCRWYAAYHHLSLFGMYVLYTFVKSGFAYVLVPIYYTLAAITVIVLEPYREEYAVYNRLDCILYLWQALFGVGVTVLNFSSYLQRNDMFLGYIAGVIVSTAPLVLLSAVVLRRLANVLGCNKRCRRRNIELSTETSLAHRITNSQEYKDNCGYVTLHTQDSLDLEADQ